MAPRSSSHATFYSTLTASADLGAARLPGLLPKRAALLTGLVLALIASSLAVTGPRFVSPAGTGSPVSLPRSEAPEVGRLPLAFEANRGQTDARVDFLARGSGYTLFLTPNEAVMALQAGKDARRGVLRMQLLGARSNADARPHDALAGKVNYLTGSDPAKWRTNIPTYGKVSYRDVYPGIDVVYYGNKGALEYDFVVAPGADPKSIALRFEGASIALDRAGDLLLTTATGVIRQSKPVLYQEIGGERLPVSGRFVLRRGREVGFDVGSYRRSQPLVIDPKLVYGTYVGSPAFDITFGNAVDRSGNVYVAGHTSGNSFPTAGGTVPCPPPSPTAPPGTSSFQCDRGDQDAFVAKLNPQGSALVYSTYLGGDRFDEAWDMAIDDAGNAYVAGSTDSGDDPGTPVIEADFPTTANGFDRTCGTDGRCNAAAPSPGGCTTPTGCPTPALSDTFLAKLNAQGTSLLYSTYLGGSDFDQEAQQTALPSQMSVAVRGALAYVAAYTASSDFPTTANAFQKTCGTDRRRVCDDGNPDAFLAVLDTNRSGRSSLRYSSYLGGSGYDEPKGVGVDRAGNAYIAGTTQGFASRRNEAVNVNNFPTKNAFQRRYGGGSSDAFVAKFNPSARRARNSLVYSTYLGGGGEDIGWDLAVRSGSTGRSRGNGEAYVTGFTDSSDNPATSRRDGPRPYFPTTARAFDRTFNGRATQANGQTLFLNGDAFVTKLRPSGRSLAYSTFLGGRDQDVGGAIAVSEGGAAYVTGFVTCEHRNPQAPNCTGSFPLRDPLFSQMNGTFVTPKLSDSPTDFFATKLRADGRRLLYSTYLPGNHFDRGFSIALRERDASGRRITPEAYYSGRTNSTDLPVTEGAFDRTHNGGGRDGFVFKLEG